MEKLNLSIYIGNKVSAIRKLRGLNQKEVAAKLGVSYQQVHKYEKGTNYISLEKLFQLSEVLGVAIDQFLPEEYISKLSQTNDALNLNYVLADKDMQEVFLAFGKIKNSRLKNACLNMLKTISERETRQ